MSSKHERLESLLDQRHVFMKRPELVREKIAALVKDGASSLQVISDFDKTITKYKHMNKKVPSSHHIIESHSFIPDKIKDELDEMQKRFYAIEIDHTITIEEKIPHMIEWATAGGKLFVKAKVRRSHIPQMVKDAHVHVRDGFHDLVDRLCHNQIPMLIFSAGVGDVVEEVLHQEAKILPNMKIVANFMEFDEDGVLSGYRGKLIHTFNKNGGALEGEGDFAENTMGRGNVILMGDMAGDLTMADGVPDLKNCLKIGFLNAKFQELLDEFMDKWDIVLEDDQTMDIPDAILRLVLG